MHKKLLVFIFLVFSTQVNAENLCFENEKVIFSFSTKSNKLLSICKGVDLKYLVYRFGRKTQIELQYPEKLDEDSWKKFTFFGVRRGGGIQNSGFGEYTLEFKSSSISYEVYQSWNDEEGDYGIGVNVMPEFKKSVQMNGIKKTQEGSLVLLEEESKYIQKKQQE